MFKLALVQMSVSGGEKEKNLNHAGKLIKKASESGADVVILPEAVDLGWTHPSAKTEASPIPHGDTCRFLRDEAKKHQIFLCSGITEKTEKLLEAY